MEKTVFLFLLSFIFPSSKKLLLYLLNIYLSTLSIWSTYVCACGIYLLLTCLLEKEMATHSSVLAWRIPGMGEPGGLPSMELHRVGHGWSDLASWHVYDVTFWFCIILALSTDSLWASRVAHQVKNLPAMQEMQETQIQTLGWEDPLEESRATQYTILA